MPRPIPKQNTGLYAGGLWQGWCFETLTAWWRHCRCITTVFNGSGPSCYIRSLVQLKLYVSLRDVLNVAWLTAGYAVAVVVLGFHPGLENQTVAVWALSLWHNIFIRVIQSGTAN